MDALFVFGVACHAITVLLAGCPDFPEGSDFLVWGFSGFGAWWLGSLGVSGLWRAGV